MNAQWADVEDYIKLGQFENAGIAIGQIVRELRNDEVESEQAEELIDAIFGEVI